MAPAKQKKGAQPSAVKAAAPAKLTRKEKSAANKAAYRAAQVEEFARVKAQKPVMRRIANGHGAIVNHGDGHKPVEYSEEIGKKICLMFATDPNMSLLVLNADPTLPTVWHFYEWLRDHSDFDKSYTRAREIWCDLRAAQIVKQSIEPLIGEIRTTRTGTDFKGNPIDSEEVRTADNVDRARLVVETQKWLLSKERPRKYGVTVDLGGGGSNMQLEALFQSLKAGPVE